MKSPLRHRIEQSLCAVVVRVANGVARVSPLGLTQRVADALAAVIVALTPRRQRTADRNIAAVFPDMAPAERQRVRRRSARCVGRTMMELLALPGMSPEDIVATTEPFDLAALRTCHQEGHGVLFISAHLGNWELMAAHLTREVAPLTVVARAHGHPLTDTLVTRARASQGVRTIGPDDTRQMLRVLNGGGILGIMPDQRAVTRGIWTDFLGRPAWTFTGPALLASRTGARVFIGFCIRDAHDRFRVECEELEFVRTADRERDVVENTRRLNERIGEAIRRYPDNWYWLHDRWKVPAVLLKDDPAAPVALPHAPAAAGESPEV